MKIRNGFVSNSSSSSFMVGIGVITNHDKFIKWKNKVDKEDDIQVVNPYEEINESWANLNQNNDNFTIDAPFNDGYQDVYLSIEEYEKIATGRAEDIAFFCFGNNEGDSAFYDDPEADWPELNHDIDFDWFSENQQEVYKDFSEESGLSLVCKTYGAGRNG